MTDYSYRDEEKLSMPDKIEEILKNIHVLFAKADKFQDSPDSVVISKKAMFELLEQLNEALDELLDRYEATTRSRERARLELDRRNAEAIAAAKRDCDDVHAATLLYTDKMLAEITDRIEQSRRAVKHELIEMLAAIEETETDLKGNMDGVKAELTEMHDSELYLGLLEKLRKRDEEKRKYGQNLKSEEEDLFDEKPAEKQNIVIRVDAPGSNSGVTMSTKASHKKGKHAPVASGAASDTAPGTPADGEAPVPKGTVFTADDFNLDAEYEQWKDEQNGEEHKEEEPRKGLFGLFKKN